MKDNDVFEVLFNHEKGEYDIVATSFLPNDDSLFIFNNTKCILVGNSLFQCYLKYSELCYSIDRQFHDIINSE